MLIQNVILNKNGHSINLSSMLVTLTPCGKRPNALFVCKRESATSLRAHPTVPKISCSQSAIHQQPSDLLIWDKRGQASSLGHLRALSHLSIPHHVIPVRLAQKLQQQWANCIKGNPNEHSLCCLFLVPFNNATLLRRNIKWLNHIASALTSLLIQELKKE